MYLLDLIATVGTPVPTTGSTTCSRYEGSYRYGVCPDRGKKVLVLLVDLDLDLVHVGTFTRTSTY